MDPKLHLGCPSYGFEACASSVEEAADYDHRVIVAGSRSFKDYEFFCEVMDKFVVKMGDESLIFISGRAATGADAMIIEYCLSRRLPWVEIPAKWDDVDAPGAVVKTNGRGRPYNALAGFWRNEEMAMLATHLVAFWDGISPGTRDMIKLGKKYSLKTLPIILDTN